ncbi:hypothetical protein PROFUN_15116 [Planoprotostelium fungivorum]|uniref:Uncharacterized protein n=1 Tax=Planoprotostelium fungivorum TaxID=1890364 RepID=A0A2P6MZS5_9EUKA|nr:hypothetical protein PROFUN_15116 [Planoprotostelium fungivorum]
MPYLAMERTVEAATHNSRELSSEDLPSIWSNIEHLLINCAF